MAKNDKKKPTQPISLTNLSKGQARSINRGNRQISGNINALMNTLANMTYGIQRTDKVDSLADEFNSLLSSEVASLSQSSDGDTTGFITRLFSDNNKRSAQAVKDIEGIFNVDSGQLEAFIAEQYRNRLIKQSDLHEVASQLTELTEAVEVTRDAIVAADIIDGHMSRTLSIEDDDMDDGESYIPIIEEMERKFKTQEKIKNFIIPRSLEYGEYYIYTIPYSKIFSDFAKEKSGKFDKFRAYSESGKSLTEILGDKKTKEFSDVIMESVTESETYAEEVQRNAGNASKDLKKELSKEIEAYMEHIEINNSPVPLCILEEGVNSYREYYTEFVEKTMTESNSKKDSEYSFDNVMKNIDTGVVSDPFVTKKSNARSENFDHIHDCYQKLMDPMKLLPIEIMDEIIGYYYIQEQDITPLSGILTSTVYYARFDSSMHENNILSNIADAVVEAFDKKFLAKNEKFKNLIVECLEYHKLHNRKIKFQFIPKEYIVPFKVNPDEHGKGRSILEGSLFYAKLYLMLLLFKLMTIILNSNDTKVNYIRQSGIEKNVSNKIQEIIRKKQQRQVTMMDMFSYTTLINKIGQGSEIYIPVGKSNERGIESEILSGQDVQLNTDLMEMLKKGYISGTGVPDVLLNYLHEAEFAKTVELANSRFQGRVVSYQLDYNEQITEYYKRLMRYSTNIPENIIETFQFNFVKPKYQNSNITNDLLSNHNAIQDFLIMLYFGQDGMDEPENADAINKFKKALAEERLPMLNFDMLDKLFKSAKAEGELANNDPDKQTDDTGEEG